MFIKPATGLVVRDPETMRQVPDTGREVPETPYWMRRLRDGDVVTATADTATGTTETEG